MFVHVYQEAVLLRISMCLPHTAVLHEDVHVYQEAVLLGISDFHLD